MVVCLFVFQVDIKRDHASFFSLHRRFQEELGLDDQEKQTIIWQARDALVPPYCPPMFAIQRPSTSLS